jgi:hypothetical protein
MSRAANKFDRELTKLFRKRTHGLRAYMWPISGTAPTLARKNVSSAINRLRNIAEDDYLKSRYARRLLSEYDYKRQWHSKKGKGFGRAAKKRSFKRWYDKKITTKNCVYAFWNGKYCLYVGRTLNGKGRPTSHFDKHWFSKATRVDVYGFDRRRDVPRFECLLTHKRNPSYSIMKPSTKKYYSPCPVCDGKKFIGDEVRWIFRLR